MKKNFINLAMVAMVAVGTVAYTGCGKKGCTTEADDNYDSAATEADPEACNEETTSGKYEGSWTGNPGSYPFTVSQTGEPDYQININTNFGLMNSTNTAQLTPTNVKATVKQDKATIALTNIYDGSVQGEITWNSSSSMAISYTLSNFPATAGVNGSYNETISK